MFLTVMRSRVGAGLGIAALIAGTSAGAATLHRYAVTTSAGSGSEGATTILQSTASGSALQGEVASSANTSIKIPFGVLGEYDATGSTFGSGVLGISTTGYGVGAESLSAAQPSLIAINSSGGPAAQMYGEQGGDALDLAATGNGFGLFASSDGSNGIAAVIGQSVASTGGYATIGFTASMGGTGTYGYSNDGVGIQGQAESDSQGLPAIQAFTGTPGTELFDAGVSLIAGVDANTSSFSISTVLSSKSANNSGTVFTSQRASSDLQINGDLYLTGTVFTNCGSSVPYATAKCSSETTASATSSSGAKYQMYESSQASKTVEDEGEAVLRGGVAHVALDPAFASVISTREPYLVFITPKGDSRGLYVSNNSSQGFDVHENAGGRSSLAFDYRIVAHPYGENPTRMTLATTKSSVPGVDGYPKPSRALATHEATIMKMRSLQSQHRALRALTASPSLMSTPLITH